MRPKDSVLISGCEDGCAYMWDLCGADRGQIFAEARSLMAFELVYPPLEVIITAVQLIKFAFRPPDDDADDTKTATQMHHVALLKYFKFDCSRETLFIPELTVVCGFMVVFLLIALFGLDEVMDRVVARAHDMPMYKAERLSFSPAHLLVKFLNFVRNFTYLIMQLGSTILVVPMVQIIAGAAHCSESTHFGRLCVRPEVKICVAAKPINPILRDMFNACCQDRPRSAKSRARIGQSWSKSAKH